MGAVDYQATSSALDQIHVITRDGPEPLLALGLNDAPASLKKVQTRSDLPSGEMPGYFPKAAFRRLTPDIRKAPPPHGRVGEEQPERVAGLDAGMLFVVALKMHPPTVFLGQFHQFMEHLCAGQTRFIYKHQAVASNRLLELLVAKELLQ
jgi:hypothetical protein